MIGNNNTKVGPAGMQEDKDMSNVQFLAQQKSMSEDGPGLEMAHMETLTTPVAKGLSSSEVLPELAKAYANSCGKQIIIRKTGGFQSLPMVDEKVSGGKTFGDLPTAE